MIKKIILTISVFSYIFLSIATLTFFPAMHSDEGWLASLTRSIFVEKNFGATEDFFHEVNRNPHAIKSLFHLLQMPFVAAAFSLFSVRFLSLVSGFVTLYFVYKTALVIFKNKITAIVLAALIALDIQFIYISHLARQEILVLMVFSVCLYIFIKPEKAWSFKKDILVGLILGFSIGIHPNIFVVTTGFVFLYLLQSVFRITTGEKKYPSLFNLFLIIFILAMFGTFYIFLSMQLDAGFFSHYLSFGSTHGVSRPLIIKILKLPRFYKKMFFQISGTYYLPNIKLQLIIFAAAFILLIPVSIIYRKKMFMILSMQILLVGINTGIVLIGKYSPPSIIFIFLPGYFLVFLLLENLTKKKKQLLMSSMLLITAVSFFTINQIIPWQKTSYNKYIGKIKSIIPDGSRTLANLNTVFAFSQGKLYSYRDLTSLNSSYNFSDYINKHKIEYIIYSDELELIYRERPVWNTMYGNIFPWYDDMMRFINNKCIKLAQWEEPVFGMRITSYMGKKGGRVTIYKIINNH